jgi:hypothetical protein
LLVLELWPDYEQIALFRDDVGNGETYLRNKSRNREKRFSKNAKGWLSVIRCLRTSYPLSELEKIAVAVINMKIAHTELH